MSLDRVADVLPTLVGAHVRAVRRDAATLFFTFAFPLLLLVLFGSVFRGQEVAGTGGSAIDHVAPGVLTWGVANAAVFSIAFALQDWRASDLLRVLQLTPTRVTTLLGSRLVVALVTALAQAALFLAVATVPYFGLRPAGGSWQVVPLLALGVVAFFGLGAVIGSLVDTTDAVAAVSNVVVLPMAFLSGAFFPLALMPDWLQTAARVLPLYHLNESVAGALAGTASPTDTILAGTALGGFALLFAAVAVRVFRWSSD